MEQKTNEKKVLVLSFLGVITLIIVVVGATYAYFTAQGGGSANTNVNVQTSTTDNLSFQVGAAISLTANQEDFGQGTGNKSGSTYARAILTANNTTNTATRNYYVYLNILNNNFEYTTEDEQGEILLKVTDPDGTEVTSIPGLTRKTSGTGENEVTGFDITTKTGSITIADNYEITASPSATQEWQIEVIFVNLDSDQNANTNKTFNANLIVRENSPIGITNVSTSNITSDSITLTVDAESENAITNYYFAKNEEEYVESDSNTYTFSGLDAGTEYTLKVYVVDEEGYQSAVYSTEESTTELTLAELCAIPSNSNLLSCAVYNQYTEDGANGIYLHDGVGTYTNADQEAGDNSYRYAGGDYQLTSTAMNAGYTSITTGVSSATNGIINFYCNGIKQDAYRNCNSSYTKYYTTAYDEKIQHTTIENALEQAVIDGYLTNSNIKNYVCFGSDEATCPNDNLYRIIYA